MFVKALSDVWQSDLQPSPQKNITLNISGFFRLLDHRVQDSAFGLLELHSRGRRPPLLAFLFKELA